MSLGESKQNCAVPEKIHTHPKEGHRKFLGGGGGVLKVKILEAKYMFEDKLENPRGREGAKQKTSMGEYGYFLELHIIIVVNLQYQVK